MKISRSLYNDAEFVNSLGCSFNNSLKILRRCCFLVEIWSDLSKSLHSVHRFFGRYQAGNNIVHLCGVWCGDLFHICDH